MDTKRHSTATFDTLRNFNRICLDKSIGSEAEDWSGKGRRVFYMDMLPNVILNPEEAPMVRTEKLQKAIPSFDWTGGHSGRLLLQEEAQKLEALWSDFLKKNEDRIDGETFNVNKHVTFDNL